VKEKGFTLLEILIVLLIFGLLAIAVVIRGASSGSEESKATAERLRSVLIYAEEQAMLRPALLRFMNDTKGYHFLEYAVDTQKNQGQLKPFTQDALLRFYPFPSKIQLNVFSESRDELNQPIIMFFPNGEITSFEIVIYYGKKKSQYKIVGKENGDIQIVKQ
jgi:type II secretion system protein H